MKPLTIKELKSLQIGNWIYLCIDADDKSYCKVLASTDIKLIVSSIDFPTIKLEYKYYGKSWLAFKNKEEAECKGELVELPYKIEKLHIGDTIYYIQDYFNEATLQHEKKVKRTIIDYIAKGHIEVNNGVWLQPNQFWLIQEQAEQKLKELRGGI